MTSSEPVIITCSYGGRQGAKGDAGSDGTAADTGYWLTGTTYAAGDRCYHDKAGYGQSVYRCKTGQGHIAGSTTEPTIGANWEDKWELFAEGGQNGEVLMDGTPSASEIMIRGSLDKHVAGSGVAIETTLTEDSDLKVPTSEAVAEYVAQELAGAISCASLTTSGPVKQSILSKTANYTITDTDPDIVVVGVISADATITLPTAADNTGRIITVIIDGKPGGHNVVVDGEGAETINGAATKTNWVIYSYLRLLCNGTGWNIIGSAGTWY